MYTRELFGTDEPFCPSYSRAFTAERYRVCTNVTYVPHAGFPLGNLRENVSTIVTKLCSTCASKFGKIMK